MPENKGIHCIVSGLVQGVYYRANTKEMAESLSLKGWVKNIPNGDVELKAFGNKENLDKLIDWLWKGPAAAKVSNVKVNRIEIKGKFEDFTIKY